MARALRFFLVFSILAAATCKQEPSSKHTSSKHAPSDSTNKGSLGMAQAASIDTTCNAYSNNYSQAIQNTPGALDSLKIPVNKAKGVLQSICTDTLSNRAKSQATASTGTTGTSTVTTDPTPIPVGKLGLVTMTPGTSQAGDQKQVVSASVKQAMTPLFKGSGLNDQQSSDAAANFADVLSELDNGLGVSFSVSGNAALGIAAGVSMAMELVYSRPPGSGIGEIGFFCTPGIMIGTGVGVSASVDVGITKTFGCPDTHSYEGGFLAHPFSVAEASVTYAVGVDGPSYVDYINYMVKAPWNTITTPEALKVEMEKFNTDFVQIAQTSNDPLEVLSIFLYIVNLTAVLDASEIIKGMVQNSSDDVKTAFSQNYFLGDIGVVLQSLLRQITSLEAFKTANLYPSTKTIYTNLLNKLVPENEYPFHRTLIKKYLTALSGCDSLSFSASVLGGSFDVAALKSQITYTYSINPQFQGPNDTYDRKKHVILDLDSFKDFGDPQKWNAMGNTFGTNLEASTQVVSSDVMVAGTQIETGVVAGFNPLISFFGGGSSGGSGGGAGGGFGGFFLADTTGPNPPCVLKLTANGNSFTCVPPPGGLGLYADDPNVKAGGDVQVGTATANYTGLDNFGPLAFVANLVNMVNPLYFYEQCLKPGADQAEAIAAQVKTFFTAAPPPPSN